MTVALVLGGAYSVYEDFEKALDLGEFDGIVGCNLVGIDWPGRFDAWLSLHETHLKMEWVLERAGLGWEPHRRVWGPSDLPKGYVQPGTSGLLSIRVTLEILGFDKVVLCGVPMEPVPHFDDDKAWGAAWGYQRYWTKIAPSLQGKVRSMGGWTASLFGQPDKDWMDA